MMRPRPAVPSLVLVLVLALAFAAPAGADVVEDERALSVTPSEIGIGIGYHGSRVRLSVPVLAGETAVFLVTGPEEELRLKVKGRAGGILWMNVAEVEFAGVPTLRLLAGVPELPSEEALAAAGLTPEALAARVLPENADERERFAFGEMLEMFRRDGVYGRVPAAGTVEGGVATADVPLPPGTREGDYAVRVVLFTGAKARPGPEGAFSVRKTGLVESSSRMARENGFLYGTIAVVVAIFAGLLTGFVFGRGKRR